MLGAVDRFLSAMAFLTRLVPSRPQDKDALEQAAPFFPLVGLALGTVCVAPLALGLAHGLPFVQAWFYLLLGWWLTRGLHWDGLADLADAWGSCTCGERFQQILKDSRMGAFGCMGLCLSMLGMFCCAAELCARNDWYALLFAPAYGRLGVLVLAALCPAYPSSFLARTIKPGANSRACFCNAVLLGAFSFYCFGWYANLLLVLLGALLLYALASLGKREGGINGDFHGAVIILGELCALFVFAVR